MVRRLPRCLVWIGLYVALIVYPTECAAYERDVHFSVTLWLAELIGFQEANAFDFAALDDVTDYHPESQPLPTVADGLELGVRRRVLFHFVDRARVNELQRLALACTPKRTTRVQQRDIGHYLHAVSDFYSHEGYEAIAGHALVFGFPDKPWNRPFQLRKMINEKFEALKIVFEKCIGGRVKSDIRHTDSQLDGWEKKARDAGPYFASDGPDHWDRLQRDLYRGRYLRYTAVKVQEYNAWLNARRDEWGKR